MAVKKDSKGVWYFSLLIDGKRYKKENKTWKKKDALEAERSFVNSYVPKEPGVNFKDVFINEFLPFYKMKNKPSTAYTMNRVMKRFVMPFFEDYDLSEIKLKDIERWQSKLLETHKYQGKDAIAKNKPKELLSNKTIQSIQSLFKAYLSYAFNHGYIDRNLFDLTFTAKHKTVQTAPVYRLRTMSEHELYMNVCDKQVYRTLDSIAFWCGMRSGEILALQDTDLVCINNIYYLNINKNYDSVNKVIVLPKTYKSRKVSLVDETVTELNKLIDMYKQSGEQSPFNLFTPYGYLPETSVRRIRNSYSELAGIEYSSIQELRHSHVSFLIEKGWDAFEISKRLGHSVEMVHNQYGHLFKNKEVSLHHKLNNISKGIDEDDDGEDEKIVQKKQEKC